jgi:hypothetical protein
MADGDGTTSSAPDLSAIGLALVVLLADERQARIANDTDAVPTDVLLSDAGFKSNEIALILRKSPGGVRAALSRSRSGGRASKSQKRPTGT